MIDLHVLEKILRAAQINEEDVCVEIGPGIGSLTQVLAERAAQVKEMLEEGCQFKDILILEAGGVTTVYANDGGIVVAY